MVSNNNKMIEIIAQFQSHINKPATFNIRQQHSLLKSLYHKIMEFLKTEVKDSTENSGVIELLLGAIEFIDEIEYRDYKNPTEQEMRAARIQIQNIKWSLRTELKLLQEFIDRGLIVEAYGNG